MVKPASKDGVLRVHTDTAGDVWFGTNRHFATNTHKTVHQFLDEVPHQRATFVRIVGCHSNARLITTLYQAQADTGPLARRPVIQLASPAICHREVKLLDPPFVLQQLWQLSASTQVPGYWHNMRPGDYHHYSMVVALEDAEGPSVGGAALRVLKYHPAWPAISFFRNVNPDAACLLLGDVIDPRWFTHPFRPNRISKLCRFLGLTLENITTVLKELCPDDSDFAWASRGRNYERCQRVLELWTGGLDIKSGEIVTPVNLSDPHNFLWRVYEKHGEWSPAKGLLRSSKLFVRFVREVWLNELSATDKVLFSPEVFFKTKGEVRSYASHVGSFQ